MMGSADSNPQGAALKSKSAKRSILWTHFTKLDAISARCDHCESKIMTSKNTSNMLTHLERYHKAEHEDVVQYQQQQKARKKQHHDAHIAAQQQPTLEEVIERTQSYSKTSRHRMTLDDALMDMIVTDLQPVSIVEDVGFLRFVKVLDPKYIPPSRRTIMRDHLPRLYEKKEKEVRDLLDKISWCTVTTDLWTSRATMGYITVTCHFIDDNWEMRSYVLETSHMDDSHTIVNLASTLKVITDKWNITNKIHCAVTDAASNITGAIRSNRWNHLVCFAHRLNLVVSCAVDNVEELKAIVTGIKKVVAFFHKSSKATDKLTVIQDQLNLPNHRLIQHVDTRWNSVFYMLERYLEQQEAVRTTLCMLDKASLVLPSDQNSTIEEVLQILRPFEAVTTELSAEKYVSASKIIPLARGLQKLVSCHLSTTTNSIIKSLGEKLVAQMATRFGGLEDKPVLAMATLLDPRFKKVPFSRSAQTCVDRMKRLMVDDAATLTTVEEEPTTTPQQSTLAPNPVSSPVWEMFDEEAVCSTSLRSPSISIMAEIDQYFKQPVISRQFDPLQWWHSNSHVYPALHNVAKVYLCTVATSVPSERLFSKAGELISAKRNRLTPENVNTFLFLNKC